MAASPEEWVARVRTADKSARFVRCALQVNPFAYLERHGKATTFAGETSYNAALVDACRKHEIEAIAVTDHFESLLDRLIAAAEEADIAAFPGFEAVSSDGVHLLVLFDRGTKARFIERCIGECGIRDRDEPSQIKSSLDEIRSCTRVTMSGSRGRRRRDATVSPTALPDRTLRSSQSSSTASTDLTSAKCTTSSGPTTPFRRDDPVTVASWSRTRMFLP